MDGLLIPPIESNKRLKRCVNDLVGLVTLPTFWDGEEPVRILRTLVDALFRMLGPSFVYARLDESFGGPPIEITRLSGELDVDSEELCRVVKQWLGSDRSIGSCVQSVESDLLGKGRISILPLSLGVEGNLGVIVAGSSRTEFPDQIERLVLSTAANKAACGLLEARRLGQQQRVTSELDRRVVQRTRELAHVNAVLEEVIAERSRTDEALRRRELDFSLIVDSIPVPVAVTTPNGEVEGVNRPTLEYFGKTLGELKGWSTSDAVHRDDLPSTVAAFVAAHEGGRAYHVESRHRRADGVYRWFNVIGMPLRDSQGQILRWFHLLVDIDDRKRAEQALAASERDLQLTIDTIPALVWSARFDGSVEYFNKHYVDYVGLQPEQLRDWGWTKAVHPDDLAGLERVWRNVMTSDEGGEAEARFRRADGEYRWLLTRVSPLRDQDGKIVRWYGINTDIEDRKRAEMHLAGEKQVLEMIAAGRAPREVLEALCRFFEKAAPDCFCGIYPINSRGKTFQYGVAPSLPASYTDPIEGVHVDSDVSPRGQSISQKAQVISEDIGSDPRWMAAPCRDHVLRHGLCSVWSTPICSAGGAVIGTVCVYQQRPGSPSRHHQELIAHAAHLASIAIERSQAEATLKRSEFYLTEGQRISLTGTFSWQLDTDELIFSEELHRIFEFEANAELTFATIGERVHPDDISVFAHNQARVRAGLDNPDYEIRLQMPDGRIKWMRVFARVNRHDDGRLQCLGAVQDVTQRRLAEQSRDKVQSELAQVSRVVSLGALTASIAHEINQPLGSIITNGETGLRWLNRPVPNLEKVRELTKRVVSDARRAAEIIDRIRNMASRGTTKQSMIALAAVVVESTNFLHHEFQSRDVSVSLDLAPDLPKILGDQTQLQQVIVALAINAVQALTRSEVASKSIAIRTRRTDAETVSCVVEDSGPGIEADHLSHLFDAFFTTKETGMGLGLAIVQSIIEAHSGRIRADNNSALGGARFVFYLPVAPSC